MVSPTKRGVVTMATNEGYAVYDETLKRFVSGLYKTKAEAEKGPEYTNAPSGHKVEARKV